MKRLTTGLQMSTMTSTTCHFNMNYYKITMLKGDNQVPYSVIVVANSDKEAIDTFKSEQPMAWSEDVFESIGEIQVKNWKLKRKPQVVFG